MTQYFSNSANADKGCMKAMSVEQFEQVVKAILEGKYSWACLLILKFAGYNPVHYIPYRTYKRLVKDNRKLKTIEVGKATEVSKEEKTAGPGGKLSSLKNTCRVLSREQREL